MRKEDYVKGVRPPRACVPIPFAELREVNRFVGEHFPSLEKGYHDPLFSGIYWADQMVSDAIALIAEAGGPGTYLRKAAEQKPRWVKFRHYPTPMKLALEMVLFEESERAALEGELEELENAWREAEDLAAISDGLIEPKGWGRERARLEGLASSEAAASPKDMGDTEEK